MSFNAIRENKILAKISESTVYGGTHDMVNFEIIFLDKLIKRMYLSNHLQEST